MGAFSPYENFAKKQRSISLRRLFVSGLVKNENGEFMSEAESEAAKARRLAQVARRLADLMHQPDIKRYLLGEANRLEQKAEGPGERLVHAAD